MTEPSRNFALMTALRRFFGSPTISDDDYRNFAARTLHYSLLVLVGITLSFGFLAQSAEQLLFIPILLIILLTPYILLRVERFDLAARTFITGLWLIVTIAAFSQNGLRNASISMYAIAIIYAAILGTTRWVIVVMSLSMGSITILLLGEMQGVLPLRTTELFLLDRYFQALGLFSAAGILLSLTAQVVRRSIEQTRQNEQRLLERNQALETEIIEREKATAALREAEARYRTISEMTSDYTYAYDIQPDGSLTPVWITRESFNRVTGYHWDEIGASFDLYHLDDVKTAQDHVDQTKAGLPTSGEYRIRTKAGELRWLWIDRQVDFDPETGRPTRLYGSGRDITERKETEIAVRNLAHDLEDSATHLATLNDIAQGIISLTDLTTTLKQTLNKLKEVLPVDIFYVAIHDPDTHVVTFPIMYDDGRFWEQKPTILSNAGYIAQVLQTGDPILINRTKEQIEADAQVEGRLNDRLGNNAKISASIVMTPLPLGDKNIGVLSVHSYTTNVYEENHLNLLVDAGYQIAIAIENARLYDSLQGELSERKRLEGELQNYTLKLESIVEQRTNALVRAKEQLELIVNTTTDALAFAKPNGDIMMANPSFSSLFEGHVSGAIEGILHAPSAEPHVQSIGEALVDVMSSGETQRLAVQILTQDGQHKDIDLAIMPVTMVEDDFGTGVLLSGHDITHLKEIERFKARFVADAVHDLATPISGLSTRVYLLQRNPDKVADHTRSLENQIRHLRNLLDELRTLANLDRGQIELQKELCGINGLVQRIFDTYEPVAIEKQQTLILKLDPTIPECRLDPGKIERVIVNLISNAINYTPMNKTITVVTSRIDNFISLNVIDQGIGIAKEDLAKVFDRFYRTDTARKQLSSGTGLGLAISKEIIELHTGSISVMSEPGQGSTFIITLPLHAT